MRTWQGGLLLSALVFTGCAGPNIHRELKDDPRVLTRGWTLSTHDLLDAGDRGFEYSAPIAHENTLIFGSSSVGVISLYPGLMQTRWVLPITGGVVSRLLADKDRIYFGGADGYLYCVQAETGRVEWRAETKQSLMSRPTVAGGRVFAVSPDDTIYAFDAATGKWLWHYKRRTNPVASIHGASAPLVDGDQLIAGMSDGFLIAVSTQDGSLKWEKKIHNGAKFTDVDAEPVLEGGVIYVPSYDGGLYALKRATQEVIWRFDAGGARRVSIDGDTIYLPSSQGTLFALQKQSAKILWQFDVDRGTPTEVAMAGDWIVFGSTYQYLYAVKRKSGEGVYRWNAGDGSGFSTAPLSMSNPQKASVYALSSGGNLYQFNLRKPLRKEYAHGAADGYRFLGNY